ncbi:hypothetical protein RTP6_007204 [Batrachochytrium dendrobatidis]
MPINGQSVHPIDNTLSENTQLLESQSTLPKQHALLSKTPASPSKKEQLQFNPPKIDPVPNSPSTNDDSLNSPLQATLQQDTSLQKTKPHKIIVDTNILHPTTHWSTSKRTPSSKRLNSHRVRHSAQKTPHFPNYSPKIVGPNYFGDQDDQPAIRKVNGKYEEIPNLLDGFRMLNRAPATDPEFVYSLDLSSQQLIYVVEDDLTLFTKLHTLRAGENSLPFARLGTLPSLKTLLLPCNGVTSLDLESESKFQKLEHLDLSFNAIDISAQIVLATFPLLKHLDLTSNNISRLATTILDMEHWHDRVIELVLPHQVAALDANLFDVCQTDQTLLRSDLDDAYKPYQKSWPNDSTQTAQLAHENEFSSAESPSLFHSFIEHKILSEKLAAQANVLDSPENNTITSKETDPLHSTNSDNIPKVNHLPYQHNDSHLNKMDHDLKGDEPNQKHPENENAGEIQLNNTQSQNSSKSQNNLNNCQSTRAPVETIQPDTTVVKPDLNAMITLNASVAVSPIGFQSLEVLILENNSLGVPDHSNFWTILQALPRLRVLNLSNNFIKSLQPLIPSHVQDQCLESKWTPTDLLKTSPNILTKLNGFKCLEELFLIKNKISTLDDLIGIICLQRLRKVFLHGNSIMKQYAPKHLLPKTPASSDKAVMDIFQLFSTYGIIIADVCYQMPKSSIEAELVMAGPLKPQSSTFSLAQSNGNFGLTSAIHRIDRHNIKLPIKKPQLIGRYRAQENQTFSSYIAAPHVVDEPLLTASKPLVEDRKRRVKYQFTDSDLQEIVKCGKIPPVRELIKLAKLREFQLQGNASQLSINSNQPAIGSTDVHNHIKSDVHSSHADGGNVSGNNQCSGDSNKTDTSGDMHLSYKDGDIMSQLHDTSQPIEVSNNDFTSSTKKIQYDPNHIDDTFLTGVHITGGDREDESCLPNDYNQSMPLSTSATLDKEGIRLNAASPNDSDTSESYSYTSESQTKDESDSDHSSVDSLANHKIEAKVSMVYPLPSTIQGSVRALRHALANPVSYWRILEESYARPTYASLKRKTAFVTQDQLRNDAMDAVTDICNETKPFLTDSDDKHLNQNPLNLKTCRQSESLQQNVSNNLPMPSHTPRQFMGTPASSMWMLTESSDNFVTLADYVPPADTSAKHRMEVGEVSYRRSSIISNGVLESMSSTGARQKLNLQLDAKFRQQQSRHGVMSKDAQHEPLNMANTRQKQKLMKQLSTVAALQRAQKSGRLQSQDEFETLNDMMSLVDSKISTIESNLASVLRNSQLEERLPQSRQLLNELQQEYSRIKNLYLNDAKATVHYEPLSH